MLVNTEWKKEHATSESFHRQTSKSCIVNEQQRVKGEILGVFYERQHSSYVFKSFSLSICAPCLFLTLIRIQVSYPDSICFRFISWASSFSSCLRYTLIWKNKRMKNWLLLLTACSMISHPHIVMILRIRHYSYVLIWFSIFLLEFLRA